MASTTSTGPASVVARDLFFAEPLILAMFAGVIAVIVFFIVKKSCQRRDSELDIEADETAHIPVSVLTAPTEPVSTTSVAASGHGIAPARGIQPRGPVPPNPPSLAQSSGGSLPESSSGRATSMTPRKDSAQGLVPAAISANQTVPATPTVSTTSVGTTTSMTTARTGPPPAVALHNVAMRPTPLTPPPSAGYSASMASTVTVDSAKSITPRRAISSFTSGKATDAQMKQMLAEQKSEDAPELSETGDMMAVNKMTNDDLKRMMGDRGTHRNPPMRRPQPLSAEVLTDASTQMLIPTAPANVSPRKGSSDDMRNLMFSQEHVIDIQKTPSRLQSLIETTTPAPPPPSETNSTKDKKLSAEPVKSDALKSEKTQPENSDSAYTPGNKDAPGKTIRKF
uniref:Secreted protein n=2 Tax=Panagrellus redivivus TaxID=6233 RepID=A0A7E4USR5_PANRE